jgi:hypothetical protein
VLPSITFTVLLGILKWADDHAQKFRTITLVLLFPCRWHLCSPWQNTGTNRITIFIDEPMEWKVRDCFKFSHLLVQNGNRNAYKFAFPEKNELNCMGGVAYRTWKSKTEWSPFCSAVLGIPLNFLCNEEPAKLNHDVALRAVWPNSLFSNVVFS